MGSSIAEIIMEGTTALVAGMGTVFVILVLISLVIGLFKHLAPEARDEKKLMKKHNESVGNQGEMSGTGDVSSDEGENLQLIAVISVILAKALNTSVDKLRVRSIRKVERRQHQTG